MNKYSKVISQIEASHEFKDKLINAMSEKERELNEIKMKKINKKLKLKYTIMSLLGMLGLLGSVGVAYAVINNKIDLHGIGISTVYEEYKDEVNESIKQDGNEIKLLSKFYNEGCVLFEFEVNVNDKLKNEGGQVWGVSFNNGTKSDLLFGQNYNLIVDNENYWVRGASFNTIKEIEANSKYKV